MPSAIALMKKMELNTPVKGVMGLVMDSGIGFGTSYGIGQIYQRHSDKWAGKNVARLTAAVGKLGAATLSVLAGGHATFGSTVLNSVGQAGVNAIGLEMGLRHARNALGKKAVLIPKTAALPAGASEMSSIGALGKAAPGRGLSWDQIEELAQGR